MEVLEITCNKCRDILSFYRPDFTAVLGRTIEAKHIDEVIRRHTLKPTNVWNLTSPRSGSAIQKSAYQCHADPDHHWTMNHVEPTAGNVKEIGA